MEILLYGYTMNKINFLKIIDSLQTVFYYGALLAVPLSFSFLFPVFSPFIIIKATWFYVLGALSLLLLLISFKLDKKRLDIVLSKKFWSLLLPIILIFLAFFVINIFSLNFTQSFFGSYERQMGLLFYFWIFIWIFLIVYRFHSFIWQKISPADYYLQEIKHSAIAMVLVSVVVAIYSFLQFTGYDFIVWQEPQLLGRPISTLGQPNFLGSFMLFGLSMSTYLFFVYKNFRSRFFLLIVAFAQLLTLILSGSRAAWIALILTSLIVSILFLWKKLRYKSFYWFIFIGLSLLFIFYLASPQRFSSLINWQEGSVALRASFYQIAPDVIANRPWLGAGLENGGELIVQKYQSSWGLFLAVNGYTDKLHNSFLDITVQTGLIGFVFYILLNIFLFKQFLLLYRNQTSRSFAIASGSALLAYGISLFFGLSDLSNVFYFWAIAALMIAGNICLNNNFQSQKPLISRFNKFITPRFKSLELLKIIASIAMAIFALVSIAQIYFSFKSLRADYYYLKFHQESLSGHYFTADVLYSYLLEDSLNFSHLQNYKRSYANIILNHFHNDNLDAVSRFLLRSRAEEIADNLSLNNYESIYTFANLKCFLLESQLALSKFDQLMELSPSRPKIFQARADCIARYRPEDSIEYYYQALDFMPAFDDYHFQEGGFHYFKFYSYQLHLSLADIYYDLGNYEQALFHYKKAHFFNVNNIYLLNKIANSYFYLEQYDKAYLNLNHAYKRQNHHYWPLQLAALSNVMSNDVLAEKYWQEFLLFNQEHDFSLKDLVFP